MLLKNKIFYILLIIFIIISKEDENKKTETCEEKINEEYKILNDNYFFNQEKSKFDNFEFELNEKIMDFIKKNDIISYPKRYFLGTLQGNFLHFMHLIYQKKLPLYFTVDQIIYPFIEITNDINEKIIEIGIYNIFYEFLREIIDYGEKNNFDENIINYFLIGFKFLNKENTTENDRKILKIIDNILDLNNTDNKDNYYYNFTFLDYERNINKINFVKINPLFNNNLKTKKLFYCITFFQNFIFNIRNELFTIYSIGKLIDKSGQSEIYKQLKIYFKYIFNEEENIMNPLELYEFINNNFKDKNKEKDVINFNLYYKFKDIIIKNRTLSFMSNYTFYNEKEEIEFNNQKNSKVSLFSYPYHIEQWINYKLLNINKKRLIPSLYEYISIVHNGNKMRNLIMNRYHYLSKNSTKNNKNKMIKFRDGINMEKEFNEVKNIIDKSIKEEGKKWDNSYENSFNYLLNIIGHSKDEIFKIDNEKNKLKKSGFEGKIFNTLIGSYIHFKKDILLFEQLTNFTFSENGTLVDVYFENNILFYEKIKEFTIILKNYTIQILKNMNNIEKRKNLSSYVETQLNKLFNAYENIIKVINYQKENRDSEEKNKIIKSLFYYNIEKKEYDGWYTDLYKINNKINYNLKIYAYNYHISEPINELNFKGSIIFGAMNYPEFGLIGIDDKFKKTKKLYLMSYYSGNEYPHGWSEEIDFDSLKRLIIRR